ncbi:MAG TPA: hypothetical protein VK780_09035 [Thermoanaerobaculia bacterium]|nr:hypothetical protein [Thermoanaerobaculia bacterium]
MALLFAFLSFVAVASPGAIVDFVAASVNDIAITESEVRKAMVVSALRPETGESPASYRARILDALIDEKLQYEDAVRFGTSPPDAADVQEAMRKLRARLVAEGKDPEAEFAAAGMTADEVRASVERQLIIQRYLWDRIRPIAVADDRTREEYDKFYVPEQRAGSLPVQPFEEVAESMRRRSQQRGFDEEVQKWAKELREKARVEIYKVPAMPAAGRTPIALSTAIPVRSPTPAPTPR